MSEVLKKYRILLGCINYLKYMFSQKPLKFQKVNAVAKGVRLQPLLPGNDKYFLGDLRRVAQFMFPHL